MNEISKNRINTIDVAKLQTYLNAMGMANNLTQGEFEQFVEIAQGFGLNPFKREIYDRRRQFHKAKGINIGCDHHNPSKGFSISIRSRSSFFGVLRNQTRRNIDRFLEKQTGDDDKESRNGPRVPTLFFG
jgi:hypothetical protein